MHWSGKSDLGAPSLVTVPGVIGDTDGEIAALVYANHDRPDLVLYDFARDLIAGSRRVSGVIQFRDCQAGATRRSVMVLDGWRRVEIDRNAVGEDCNRCHIDSHWVDRMGSEIQTSIRRGIDAVVVNRFGPLEAAGRGFCDAIRVASETETPLIIAVPDFEFARWTRFSNGMTVRLDCRAKQVREWWQRVSTRSPLDRAPRARVCEFK